MSVRARIIDSTRFVEIAGRLKTQARRMGGELTEKTYSFGRKFNCAKEDKWWEGPAARGRTLEKGPLGQLGR